MSRDLFEAALAKEGVTGNLADIARSVYHQESGSGANTTTSNAGAVGGMQIIPSTFASMADKGWDISNPEHNARAGIRYLNHLHGLSGGDPTLTAVGYYGGPGAMEKARNGIAVSDPRNPNAPNTLQYAQQVLGRINGGMPTGGGGGTPANHVPTSDAEWAKLTQLVDQQKQAPVKPADLKYPAPANEPVFMPKNTMSDFSLMDRYMPSNKVNMTAFNGWGTKL